MNGMECIKYIKIDVRHRRRKAYAQKSDVKFIFMFMFKFAVWPVYLLT